jgi:hypothetical protein
MDYIVRVAILDSGDDQQISRRGLDAGNPVLPKTEFRKPSIVLGDK